MRITFQQISYRSTKAGKCPECGKRRQRSTTFWQTWNPFNKNAAGTPKTRDEIWRELRDEAAAWAPDFTCASHAARLPEKGGESADG